MKKKNVAILISALSSLFLLLFTLFKFDLTTFADIYAPLGAELVLGFVILAIYGLYAIFALWSFLYAFLNAKTKKWMALVPMLIMIPTIYLIVFFPYTKAYFNLYLSINQNQLQKTVQMQKMGRQIDRNEYIVPYRFTSFSGVMYTQVNGEVKKDLFYTYNGFQKDIVIVYTSDDSGIDKRDFSECFPTGYYWNFREIHKIERNWYSATVYH